MSQIQKTDTPFPVTATTPADYRADPWASAVAMAGKAVVSTVLGCGVAYVEVDTTTEEIAADFFWAKPLDNDKIATVELAGDAAMKLLGFGEMKALGRYEMYLHVGDAEYAYATVGVWKHWFEYGDGHDFEFDTDNEVVFLLEACRLRALRILSRPGHKEAVEALARAVRAPAGISGEDAEKLIRDVIAERRTDSAVTDGG